MTDAPIVFDGKHCPTCGREVIEDTGKNWETVYRCPKKHFVRQTNYTGDTPISNE